MTIQDGICGRCNKPTLTRTTGHINMKGKQKTVTLLQCDNTSCNASGYVE